MHQCLNASSFYFKCALSTAPPSQKVKAKLQAISYCLERELATSSTEGRALFWDYLPQLCIQMIFAPKGIFLSICKLNFCYIVLSL